jgi:hypothetical protein
MVQLIECPSYLPRFVSIPIVVLLSYHMCVATDEHMGEKVKIGPERLIK